MVVMQQVHLPRLLLLNKDIINNYNTPPPESSRVERSDGGNINGAAAGDSDFDSNMVIILAALLCALICALGLNSIVRCALRCSRRFALETTDHHHHRNDVIASAAAGVGADRLSGSSSSSTGLKKEVLKQIPVFVYNYSSSESDTASGVNVVDVVPATECPICLAEFSQGDKVRILPGCNHGFHVNCIDTWLLSHSSCPTCRHLLSASAAAAAATT